jgi:PAS domain S-box-containing protein
VREILRLAPHMLALVEPDGRVSWLNDVALEYLGMRSEDVGRDRFREEVIHPEDFHEVEPQREEAFRTSSPFDAEEWLRDRQGRYRWFLAQSRSMPPSSGAPWEA